MFGKKQIGVFIGGPIGISTGAEHQPLKHLEVGGKENPVLMRGKHLADFGGCVATQLRNTGCEVGVEIGAFVEPIGHPAEVF